MFREHETNVYLIRRKCKIDSNYGGRLTSIAQTYL